MKYPIELVTVFTDRNGIKVEFRPCQSDDTEMLWEMFPTLSENSACMAQFQKTITFDLSILVY